MNSYELKQAMRKARFEELADKAIDESEVTYARAKSMSDAIPFGQPILVGHYSENRDRRFRDRIHNTYGKAFALQEKAKYYQQKAASVGTGGVSSDDPAALDKLREQLAKAEAVQERMKAANRTIRAHKTHEARCEALATLGFSEAVINAVLRPDRVYGLGFASFELSNNSANIRRIKARIDMLEKMGQREDVEVETEGYTFREDVEENRVMFLFPGKPTENVRALLKSHSFKWSPSRGAWVRQRTANGLYAARQVREALDQAAK